LTSLCSFSRKHEIRPRCILVRAEIWLADDLAQSNDPLLFEAAVVGVEVDGFAIGEADTEAFFNVRVALVFFAESRLATAFSAGFCGRCWISD
jgi:hypothetical protein